MSDKKKVYVETTVVSDATALPTNNLALAGRQMVTRERRIVMIYDESLEEIWRIKREIASEYATLDDYFKGMLAYQEQERENGVKFVSFPVLEREPAIT